SSKRLTLPDQSLRRCPRKNNSRDAIGAARQNALLKTLGMIGGIGPESTIDYYKNIIALYRERKPDGHYPQFVINSIDLQKGIDFLEAGDLAGMADFLVEEIKKLPPSGAEFGIIAAN